MGMSHYTPITPRGGGLVHAVSLHEAERTVCKRLWSGWVVVSDRILSCPNCRAAVHLPVKVKR